MQKLLAILRVRRLEGLWNPISQSIARSFYLTTRIVLYSDHCAWRWKHSPFIQPAVGRGPCVLLITLELISGFHTSYLKMAMDTFPFSSKWRFTPNKHDVLAARRNFLRPVRRRITHHRLSRHDDGLQTVAKTYTSVCTLGITSSYWESPYQFTDLKNVSGMYGRWRLWPFVTWHFAVCRENLRRGVLTPMTIKIVLVFTQRLVFW